MSFYLPQFKDLIERVLKDLDLHSESAVNLLLGTAAQESAFGTYLRQLNDGPARGVFQMEPATEKDIWENYLEYKQDLVEKIEELTSYKASKPEALEDNLAYAIIMTRLHYRRVPSRLPGADDVDGLAKYWKQHYNTELGAGTVDEFKDNYQKYVEN